MVAVFVALTIIALLAVDYFFIHPRQQKAQEEILASEIMPISETFHDIPAGIFLQPSFTWTKFQDDGSLVLGLHPMILGLIGPPYEIELLQDKELVEKGDPLIRIKKSGRYFTIKAPIEGEIQNYNQALLGETDWEHLGMSWLYRIKPEHVSLELPIWQYSEDADEWAQNRYNKIKAFVFEKLASTSVGVTMADGGEMPIGILSELDDDDFQEFKTRFMT